MLSAASCARSKGMATTLARRGHEVTVLTTDALDHRRRHAGAQDEMIEGVRVLAAPECSCLWLRGRFNLSTPRSMKRSAEAILPAIDVLHIHEFRTLENLLVTPVAQTTECAERALAPRHAQSEHRPRRLKERLGSSAQPKHRLADRSCDRLERSRTRRSRDALGSQFRDAAECQPGSASSQTASTSATSTGAPWRLAFAQTL